MDILIKQEKLPQIAIIHISPKYC